MYRSVARRFGLVLQDGQPLLMRRPTWHVSRCTEIFLSVRGSAWPRLRESYFTFYVSFFKKIPN
jgi:hypothetical protein